MTKDEQEQLLDEEAREHLAGAPNATKLIYPSKVVQGIVFVTREEAHDDPRRR